MYSPCANTIKIIFRRCRGRVQVWLGSKRTTDGTGKPGRMQVLKTCICNADDDMARCNTQANDMAKIANNWKTPGASVSGRHNTPPLQEDVVPRSRMAPERNGRGRVEVKLSCFFDKRVKPWTLRGWTNWKKEYNQDEQSRKHSVIKEEQGTSREPCRLKDIRKKVQLIRSTWKHSGWNEMYKER